MDTITRIFEFDAAHRVMNEKVKCFNLHGHRFKVEITFEYSAKAALGYAVDFKELKRIAGAWIDEHLDHACLLNPMDSDLIDFCLKKGWRLHVMGMGSISDRNPSAENIASELFSIMECLFLGDRSGIRVVKIRLYETPNCWVETDSASYGGTAEFMDSIRMWRKEKGEFNYDIRQEPCQ